MKFSKFAQFTFALTLGTLSLSLPHTSHGHCQVPCGIYNDGARVEAMLEDAATILKATRMLAELEGKTDAQSINQATRWVINKEQHAQNIIATLSDYFLTQRLKPSQSDYTERLVIHHAVILAAMKAKQTADKQTALDLSARIEALTAYYAVHRH